MALQMIRKGDHGPIVHEIQGNLARSGHATKADGLFGGKTDVAVRAFQKANGFPVDGVVGPRTMAALHRRPTQPKPPAADEFDPAAFGAWLARLPGAIYDALRPDEPTPSVTRSVPAVARQKPVAATATPPRAAGRPVISPT